MSAAKAAKKKVVAKKAALKFSSKKAQAKRAAKRKAALSEANVQEGLVQLPAYARNLWIPKRYKVMWGGRGGARSWSVARVLLIKAAQSKLRILCTREMQSSLRDSVHQLLRDQIELMGLPGFEVTDREIRHSVTGSVFLFEGLRYNVSRVKSLEGIDICWVEEAERISARSWQVLIPTIRKSGSEIWITFNPDQEADATYQRFIVHTPKDTWKQQINWEDNYWLTDELRAEKDYAYETDPEAAEHVWGGGLRTVNEAQILRGKWKVQEFTVPRDIKGDPLWNGPYQGEDFGFGTDPAAAVRCWVHDQVLYIEHEMYAHKLELDDTPQMLEDCIPGFSEYVTRADSSRPDSISFLRRHGISRIAASKKGAGSVEDGIAHLRAYRAIIIHPRCKHTVDEAKLYAYKVDQNSGDVLPIIVDKHNHIIDSIRYALEPMIQPRRKAGFLFVNTLHDKVLACPTCESALPDDGECPHCGAFVNMNTGELIEDLPEEGDDEVMEELKRRVHDLTVVEETPMVSIHKNGNGSNGHSNGNGSAASTSTDATRSRFARLRGLND
jgi:phage terminase large subunit